MRQSNWLGAAVLVSVVACWFAVTSATPAEAAASGEWPLFVRGTALRSEGNREMVVRALGNDLAPVDAYLTVFDTSQLPGTSWPPEMQIPPSEAIAETENGVASISGLSVGNKMLFAFLPEGRASRVCNLSISDAYDRCNVSIRFTAVSTQRIHNDTPGSVEIVPVYRGPWPDLAWQLLVPGASTDLCSRTPDGLPTHVMVRRAGATSVGERPRDGDIRLSELALVGLADCASGYVGDLPPALSPFSIPALQVPNRGSAMAMEVAINDPFRRVRVIWPGHRDVCVTDSRGVLWLDPAQGGRAVLSAETLHGGYGRLVGVRPAAGAAEELSLRGGDDDPLEPDETLAPRLHLCVFVSDIKGLPVEKARVVLCDATGRTALVGPQTTDARGFAAFAHVPAGDGYSLHVFRTSPDALACRDIVAVGPAVGPSVRAFEARLSGCNVELPPVPSSLPLPAPVRVHDEGGKLVVAGGLDSTRVRLVDIPRGIYCVKVGSEANGISCSLIVSSTEISAGGWR